MTTGFSLSLQKYNLEMTSLRRPNAQDAVMVDVRQVADSKGKCPDKAFTASVRVPAGTDAVRDLDAPPGGYILEARLPSGVVVREEKTITSGKREDVRFDAGHSPHEWLSWQVMVGAAPRAGAPKLSFKDAPAEVPIPQMHLVRVKPAAQNGWFDWNAPPEEILKSNLKYPTEFIHDGRFALWRISMGQANEETRPLAVVSAGKRRWLVALPSPWTTSNWEQAPVEVLIDLHATERDWRQAVKVTVLDNEASALMSYFGAGRMTEAASALADMGDARKVITRLIGEKQKNPLSAAAAGYVALASFVEDDGDATWRQWLVNLMNWFEWLPDGAILHARSQMDVEKYEPKEILALFKEAYRRGPPVFSAGVRMLMSGLFQFAGEDKEALAMHEDVARFAASVDPNQPFVVYGGSA